MGRRPWWAWCCAIAAPLLCVPGQLVPGPSFQPLYGIANLIAILVIVAGGMVALGEPGQTRNGVVMLGIAVMIASDCLGYAATGPWEFTSYVLEPFDALLFLLLLLRWPKDRLQTRLQVRMFRLGIVVVPALYLADALTRVGGWDPRPNRTTWWPRLFGDVAVNSWISNVRITVETVLLVAYVVLVALRVHAAARPERRELVPVVVAASMLTVLYVMVVRIGFTPDWLRLLLRAAYVSVPLALLIAVGVRRVQRALAVESLLRPERLPTPTSVRAALARAMGDPRLGLALYSPTRHGYVDLDGASAGPVEQGRHAIEVPAADGTPIARIDVDERLAARPELTGSVVRAAVVALDNARLQADLRAQLRETETSRLRLEEAAKEGERLTRLLPSGLADKLRADPSAVDRTEQMTVTVLMSDVRGYSGIAERAEPSTLSRQLNEHRQAMNKAILAEGGTVMQYVGDAVMAVFGAPFPQPDHAVRALRAAVEMHARQAEVNAGWAGAGLAPFGLGIGVSTGPVAAALLGSDERVEYTLVGDTVNLAQRLENAARPAGSTVVSAATVSACDGALPSRPLVELPALLVKGRTAPVPAYLLEPVPAGETATGPAPRAGEPGPSEPEGSALGSRAGAAARRRDAG